MNGADLNNDLNDSDEVSDSRPIPDDNLYGDEDDADDDQEFNEEEQLFLQQQLQNEFMNAGEEDSDDGIMLAGDAMAGSAYN